MKSLVVPNELKIINAFMQGRYELPGLSRRTIFKQNAEFVTSQSRNRVALAHLVLQAFRQTPQQFVAGNVAAGVINHLELVEIQITQCVLTRRFLDTRQQRLQALLESPPIEEIGERIVARLITKLLGEAVGITYVATGASVTDETAVFVANGLTSGADNAPCSIGPTPEALNSEWFVPISQTLPLFGSFVLLFSVTEYFIDGQTQ
jgi:hypothetical protein